MKSGLPILIVAVACGGCTTTSNLSYWMVRGNQSVGSNITVTTMSGNDDVARADADWLATLGDRARNSDRPDLAIEAACKDPEQTPDGWRPGASVTIITSAGPVTRTIASCRGDLPGHVIEAEFALDRVVSLPALAVQGGAADSDSRVIAPPWRSASAELRERVVTRLAREIAGIRALSKTAVIDVVSGDFGGPNAMVRAQFRPAGCDQQTDLCTLYVLLAQKPRGVLEVVHLAGYTGSGDAQKQYGEFDAFDVHGLLSERRDGPWRIIIESVSVGYMKTQLLQVAGGRWVWSLLSGFVSG